MKVVTQLHAPVALPPTAEWVELVLKMTLTFDL